MTISLETAGILSVWLEVSNDSVYLHVLILSHLPQTLLYGTSDHYCVDKQKLNIHCKRIGIYTSLFFESVFIMWEKRRKITAGPSGVCTVSMTCFAKAMSEKSDKLDLLRSQRGHVYLNHSPHW
jgi:hypothetical protein